MKPFAVRLLLPVIAAVLVASCGHSNSPTQASSPTEQPVITGQPAAFNADDVAFVTNMIAIYHQTTALTALVPERSTNPKLITVASDIDAAQQPDLEMMKVLLVQWNSDSDSGTGKSGSGNPAAAGAVDDATMARLGSLRGQEFDAAWLQTMIGHQQGAIAMAEAETTRGTNVDAVASAKQLVGKLQAQVGRMQQLLGGG